MKRIIPFLISLFFIQAKAGEVQVFTPTRTTSAGRVLILPPTGGENIADRQLAEGLSSHEIEAVIFNYPQEEAVTKDLKSHDRVSMKILKNLSGYLDQERKPVVLYGSSLGSLYASMAYGLKGDLRFPGFHYIQAVVLTLAGGPLAEILATSQLSSVREQREERFKIFGFKNPQEYESALKAEIHFDPEKLVHPEWREHVLMFSSSNDSIIVTPTQENLWQAWGKPERQVYGSDHKLTIIRVDFFKSGKISEFARKQLPAIQ